MRKGFVVRKYFSQAFREIRLQSKQPAGVPMKSPEMEALRKAHLECLDKLKAEGKLFCSGPMADWSCALDIYHVDSIEEVEKLLKSDPFAKHNIFIRNEIEAWYQSF